MRNWKAETTVDPVQTDWQRNFGVQAPNSPISALHHALHWRTIQCEQPPVFTRS